MTAARPAIRGQLAGRAAPVAGRCGIHGYRELPPGPQVLGVWRSRALFGRVSSGLLPAARRLDCLPTCRAASVARPFPFSRAVSLPRTAGAVLEHHANPALEGAGSQSINEPRDNNADRLESIHTHSLRIVAVTASPGSMSVSAQQSAFGAAASCSTVRNIGAVSERKVPFGVSKSVSGQ